VALALHPTPDLVIMTKPGDFRLTDAIFAGFRHDHEAVGS
jgi:hypothetical protein